MPLHPFVTAMLEQLKDRPGLSDGSPDDARTMMAAAREAMGKGPAMAEVHDFDLPTRDGSIAARLLVPAGGIAGMVVYLHGGGWVIGTIDDFDACGRALAAASGCAVLLPDYRLAPEAPFPAPLHDAEDAVLWAADQAATRFGGPVPVVVAGDSAGGNLAAVLARRLRGRVPLALQALIYPVTEASTWSGSSATTRHAATGRIRTSRRSGRRTWAGSRRQSSRWPNTTFCWTRATPMPTLWRRRVCR